MVIGGTKRTLVWDDLNPQQRVSVYDRGVDIASVSQNDRDARVSYRLGDTWAPALAETEALAGVASEFAAAIREGRSARPSGASRQEESRVGEGCVRQCRSRWLRFP